MDTESGKGSGEIPVNDWFTAATPGLPGTHEVPSGSSSGSAVPPHAQYSQHSDFFDSPRMSPGPNLFNPPGGTSVDPFGNHETGTLRPAGGVVPWRLISAVVGVIVVAGGVAAAVVFGMRSDPTPAPNATGSPIQTPDTTPATVAAVVDPCKGLQGQVVGHEEGTANSPTGVVAALQYAYYVKRDANAVMALYTPQAAAGVDRQAIASWIQAIPQGTRYCVAATQLPAPPPPPGQPPQVIVNFETNDVRPGSPEIHHDAKVVTLTPAAPYAIVSLQFR